MKLPKAFIADKDLSKHKKNLLKQKQRDMFRDVHIFFSKKGKGIYGLDLFTNKLILFEFLGEVKDFAIHKDNLYICCSGSLYMFGKGLKDIVLYPITSLLNFKGELYNSYGILVTKPLTREIVAKRIFEIVTLLDYKDRLCDVEKLPCKALQVHDTLDDKFVADSMKPATHVVVLDDKFYFSDEKGDIFNKDQTFVTPATSITALAPVNGELYFTGKNLENTIMALDPKTKEERVVITLEEDSKSLITQIKEDKSYFMNSLEEDS